MRCLCNLANSDKVAKLVFQIIHAEQDVPSFASRLEALSTVLVFVLTVDTGPEDFESQLEFMADFAETMRVCGRIRAKLRPVRAVLLARSSEQATGLEAGVEELWASKIADFEQNHGELWKFGPVDTQDSSALYDAFAEMD